jgi:hypothetical protein
MCLSYSVITAIKHWTHLLTYNPHSNISLRITTFKSAKSCGSLNKMMIGCMVKIIKFKYIFVIPCSQPIIFFFFVENNHIFIHFPMLKFKKKVFNPCSKISALFFFITKFKCFFFHVYQFIIVYH